MHLGLDCGEQYFKAIIMDIDTGEILHEVSVSYDDDFAYRNTRNGYVEGDKAGECYVDPQMWVESLDTLIEKLSDDGADLSTVKTLSGMAVPSLVFLNESFPEILTHLNPSVPLNDLLRPSYASRVCPISRDTSASENADTIRRKFSRDTQMAQVIGSKLDSSKGAAQIHQLYSASKSAWEQTASVHVTSSFIHSILIGKPAPLDFSDSAQLGLYDLVNSEWHHELLELTAPGLKERLPQLTKSNKTSGPLSDYFTFKYGFSDDVECFPWVSRDAAMALGHGIFDSGASLLCLGDSYEYFNYLAKLPEEIPNHASVTIHPMGGFLTKFTLNNGMQTFNQTIKNLNLNAERIETQLDSLPSAKNLPSLPFLSNESDDIQKADQKDATLLSLASGQILHLQLFSQWADSESTELTITGEGAEISSLRLLCSNIFQVPTYHHQVSNELVGTVIPYLISEHQSISLILKDLIHATESPETKPEPFMAGFYTNQLQEYFHLLTNHIN